MAEPGHRTTDRRLHARGNNLVSKVPVKAPRAKQASKAAVSQSSTFKAAAGYHAEATHMPRMTAQSVKAVAPGGSKSGG
jgi:hypothetical protein